MRHLAFDDVDEWFAGHDEEQLRWFEFPRNPQRDDVARAIAAWQESWSAGGPVHQWGVCLRSSGAIVGGIELSVLNDGEVNLSYVVFPSWRRLGIATRSAHLALSYARLVLNVRTAILKILEGNIASLAVARKLGAVEVGAEPSDAGGRFIVLHRTLIA